MTDAEPSSGRRSLYRFSRPGAIEIETGEFNGDDTAETRARELSKTNATPVIIRRHQHGDDWEYVTEVDERL
jgi:hypothetical protein